MRISLFIVIVIFPILFGQNLYAAKLTEIEVWPGSFKPEDLVLQTGEKVVFRVAGSGSGPHKIVINDGFETIASLSINKDKQTVFSFKQPGKYVFFLEKQESIRGQVTVFTEDKIKVSNTDLRKQKVSYSIGFDFGQQVVKKLDNLDLQLFIAGLQHAYNNEPSKLNEGEMEFIIADYKRELSRRAKIENEKKSKANLTISTEFLAKNKQEKGVVTKASGLQYKILKNGNATKPLAGDRVQVSYKGRFINGSEFEDSKLTGASEFILNSQILPGMTEGLTLMSEGSRWQLFLPPHLAYGQRGRRKVRKGALSIAPNSTLIFDIELIKVLGKN